MSRAGAGLWTYGPSPARRPVEYHHLGVTLSGRVRAQMPDGTELEIGPGDVFEIPPGHDAWVVGDEPWVSVDFEAMRTYGKARDAGGERILASIVFTDIVNSTGRAADLGATRWRDLVGEHNRKASAAIDRHRGRLVKTTGDGVLAQFDGAEPGISGRGCHPRRGPGPRPRHPRWRPHGRASSDHGRRPRDCGPHGRPHHGRR